MRLFSSACLLLFAPSSVFAQVVDTDGDSYSDAAEIAFGSDPQSRESSPDHTPNAARPNLVIIYADDMGFGDVSAYGGLYNFQSPATTPKLDAFAAEGVVFTQAHSGNAVCTPSRYALLTGKYNWREFDGITNHYGGVKDGEIPRPEDVTIAEFLKEQGYDTAAFGKWHLGGAFYTRVGVRILDNVNNTNLVDWARPVEHHATANGFDLFLGLAQTINQPPFVYMRNDRVQYWDETLNGGDGGYRDATNSDRFLFFSRDQLNSTVVGAPGSRAGLGDPSYKQVEAGPQMITQVEEYLAGRANSGDQDPFFAYVSLYSPHKPWAITPPFIGTEGFNYGDFLREVDDRVGRVLTALSNHGFSENTMVVFTSDNGPENTAMQESIGQNRDTNGPFRGNKRDVWDGGTRVPFIVRWPGQAAPGIVTDELIWQGDIFATIAAFLNVDLPTSTAPDGESFLNVIRGQDKPSLRRPSIVISSNRGDLGLKTIDGWKFIDATGGGGNDKSWDSQDRELTSPSGVDQGLPKQLFNQSNDLGEDTNLIATLDTEALVRAELINLTGIDLLQEMDLYRTTITTERYLRIADNDADGMSNTEELSLMFDPNSPRDGFQDLDGDSVPNRDEVIAGTDPRDPLDFLHISDLSLGNDISITWSGVAGRQYEVSWSLDLENWTPHTTVDGIDDELQATLSREDIDAQNGIQGDLDHLYLRVSASRM